MLYVEIIILETYFDLSAQYSPALFYLYLSLFPLSKIHTGLTLTVVSELVEFTYVKNGINRRFKNKQTSCKLNYTKNQYLNC